MADLPQHDVLRTVLDDGWLSLTLDDPERKNALSAEMAAALSETLEAVSGDRSVRGITLRGAGGVFCAGGDLKGMAGKIMAGDRDAIEEMSRDAGRLFEQIYRQPQPVVALVDGPALAGGLGLVACADVVAVTPGAKFALTEVQLGIPPAQIAPYVVGRLGLRVAKRLMLTAARFEGREAFRIGLADHLADNAEDLEVFETSVRKALKTAAPGAVAATKELSLLAAEALNEDLRASAARSFAACLLSDEGREGIRSFIEKRKPGWADD